MATGYFLKTSADAGAPPMRNVPGDMIAVLDWALLPTGFWQKVYSGTNKAVYRATTGNRFYLWVDDTGATTASVRGYQTMTGLDAGTTMFPDLTQQAVNTFYAVKSSIGTARTYRIVGDCTFFALLVHYDGGTYVYPLMFGDVAPYDPNDTFSSMLYASSSTATGGTSLGALFAASSDYSGGSRVFWPRDPSGLNPSMNGNVATGVPNAAPGDLSRTATPVFAQTRLMDYNRSTPVNGHMRATLPYVYCMPYTVNESILPTGTPINIAGSTWLPLNSWAGAGAYALLRMTNDEPGRP
jgi:hypothetical protein